MSEDRPDQGESIDLSARLRAYESVKAVLANGHHVDRGPAAVRGVVTTVLAESGVDGLAEVAVELSLRLASAVERRAADQGLAAVDLADVWFVDARGPASLRRCSHAGQRSRSCLARRTASRRPSAPSLR